MSVCDFFLYIPQKKTSPFYFCTELIIYIDMRGRFVINFEFYTPFTLSERTHVDLIKWFNSNILNLCFENYRYKTLNIEQLYWSDSHIILYTTNSYFICLEYDEYTYVYLKKHILCMWNGEKSSRTRIYKKSFICAIFRGATLV